MYGTKWSIVLSSPVVLHCKDVPEVLAEMLAQLSMPDSISVASS